MDIVKVEALKPQETLLDEATAGIKLLTATENYSVLAEKDATESNPRSQILDRIIRADIMTINGKINNMDEKKLLKKFGWFKFKNKEDMMAYRKQLKKELANHILNHADVLYHNSKVVPYYVVIDYEATCEIQNPPEYCHEIIEFPAILVNSSTLETIATFRRFCRPTLNPQLSDFCTELTGITQQDVDSAEEFSTVLELFSDWMTAHGLTNENSCVVTDGPWDLSRFLHVQCHISGVGFPGWAEKWLDLGRVFNRFYKEKRCSLSRMLDLLGMSFEGRPHCGYDDALNIARVLVKMICDGANLMPNQRIVAKQEHLSEGEAKPMIRQEKFLTHRDVKIERSKRIHALTKHLDTNEENITYHDVDQLVTKAANNKKHKSSKNKRKNH